MNKESLRHLISEELFKGGLGPLVREEVTKILEEPIYQLVELETKVAYNKGFEDGTELPF